ncbi:MULTISPECIES: hypothetical protein [unclassified Pseudomonas]|uniref:hypothetical protein n=1 Tax=unclassified Pseudomonas TaxID=196821 RepID=UPI00200E55D2|nr:MULTISPECIES: hypothetical protein [unclassified Pseudomonas]
MKTITIDIVKNLKREKANIVIDRKTKSLTLIMKNCTPSTYTAADLYICFGLIRASFPKTQFLCKGAKINVHPSRMSSQMSAGLVAYEVRIGCPTDGEDSVNIFDYEEKNLTNDIQDQKKHYQLWIESIAPTHRSPA